MLEPVDLGGDGWTLRLLGGWDDLPAGMPLPAVPPPAVPAQVPGTVHTDLMAAGLLADPHLGLQEAAAQWVGLLDWSWSRPLPAELAPQQGERVDLVLEGLDTVVTVRVGDEVVLRSESMHLAHRVDVTDALSRAAGEGPLVVDVRSAIRFARERRDALGDLPQDYEHPYNFVRKAAYSMGWDWGPTLSTAGVWRPVRLERWRTARLGEVLLRADLPPGSDVATVVVEPDVVVADGVDPAGLRVEVEVADADGVVVASTDAGGDAARVEVAVAAPRRWWPRGYGAPYRHRVTVRLRDADGGLLHEHVRHVGFRSVALDTTPDEIGRPFTLLVNDRPVFVLGANWIPRDSFLPRVTPDRLRASVGDALDAGMNLLRVWGGGVVEDDALLELCDEVGLMLWQDFPFACAAYPQDEGTVALVRAEAQDAVRRLVPHPSVVLFNGSNENELAASDWGWDVRAPGRPWGERLWEEVLPAVVHELAPQHPYIPSSPTSLDPQVHPNDPDHGATHQWDVWNRLDFTHYRDAVPRFAAEYGFQGPPGRSTFRRALGQDPVDWRSPLVRAHQKQAGGTERLNRNLAGHTAPPATYADWHLATSLNQAWALRTAVTHLRSWWPRSAGSVIWQLDDCWPVVSWSLVDGDGVRKPAWYAVRAAHAPRLVTVQPREAGLVAALVNDTDEEWAATLRLVRRHVDGRELATAVREVRVPARDVATVPVPVAVRSARRRREELVVASVDGLEGVVGGRDVWALVDQDALLLPAGRRTASVVVTGPGEADVVVEAQETMLDTVLLPDLVAPSARAESCLVTLFPGERHVFRVMGLGDADPTLLTGPEVLRCANEVTRAHG
ncbi:glycoside hydrolase family 2 protein [Lapillicoccus jejuensis]|uniref:beta-mannosidase n=1 Tax=Lapillicoccus jejuensis TaxID=402171 RepID=A0A542E055_9MICO|nr:glycoside hydrolase family 2 protein [Lapillicoccus jejuensis]TQJ08732.1 beta-mannosidase [Lapillicoccus jejuensis]